MPRSHDLGVCALSIVALAMSATTAADSAQRLPVEDPLPPISWTCPMDPEVLEAAKGICPICKMDLVPVRLDTIWSCPVHAVVFETLPGRCPICGRDLARVTVALSWTCTDQPEIDELEPGKCPGGSPMMPKRTPRAHGNHNPQHGGLFFMAPDNWHHLEGAYPQAGRFQLHLYDDYSRPLPADALKRARGRVVMEEAFDSGTRAVREIAVYPLVPAPNGEYLEAAVEPRIPPAQMTAKIRLTGDGPEYRFDFAFARLSSDTRPDSATAVSPAVDPSQVPIHGADTDQQILALLSARSRQIGELLERGALGEIYLPALQAKDLALALDDRATGLSPSQRTRAAAAIKRLVRAAWLLDAHGDLGNREEIAVAYSMFAEAFAEIEAAFGGARKQP